MHAVHSDYALRVRGAGNYLNGKLVDWRLRTSTTMLIVQTNEKQEVSFDKEMVISCYGEQE
jgi:hypothetical protein